MSQAASPLALAADCFDPRLSWQRAACGVLVRYRHATVRLSRIKHLLPHLPKASNHAYWHDYVSPELLNSKDIDRLFLELALTISQFGGFTYHRPDGRTAQWKLDGSGVKALLATMHQIREAECLPGVHVADNVRQALAPFLIDKPFAAERLQAMEEIAAPEGRAVLRCIIRSACAVEGFYRFGQEHVLVLSDQLPAGFGGDPLFHKKASLLLLTMDVALCDLGIRASAHTIPPADYRIPQVLETFGVLQFSTALAQKLAAGHVFRQTDPEVISMRAATTVAVHFIERALNGEGRAITTAELDSMLYHLSRDPKVAARQALPHMNVATLAF